jgi:hypothetical protein
MALPFALAPGSWYVRKSLRVHIGRSGPAAETAAERRRLESVSYTAVKIDDAFRARRITAKSPDTLREISCPRPRTGPIMSDR